MEGQTMTITTVGIPPYKARDDVVAEVKAFAETRPDLKFTYDERPALDPRARVPFTFEKDGKTFLIWGITSHQMLSGTDGPDDNNYQILCRTPEFLDYLIERCETDEEFRAKRKITFDGYEDYNGEVDPRFGFRWTSSFTVNTRFIDCAVMRKSVLGWQKEGHDVVFAILGDDHVETVTERLNNLFETGRIDRRLRGGDRGSNQIRTIHKILKDRGCELQLAFEELEGDWRGQLRIEN